MRYFFFLILLFILIVPNTFCEETQLGTIVVTDSRIDTHTNADMPEMFTTVINVANDANAQSQTLSDILRSNAEVKIKSTGGESGVSTVTMRGSSSKNVLIMIDGIPVNTDSNSTFDLSIIPTAIIDRIEITRGGTSSEYGSAAMGGVINIITKNADTNRIEYMMSEKNFRSAETGVSFSFRDSLTSVLMSYSDKFDLGNYLYRNDNGTEFNTDDDYITRMQHNAVEKQTFLLKNSFRIKKASVGYGLTYSHKRNEVSGPTAAAARYSMAKLNSNLITANIMGDLGQTNRYFTAKFDLRLKSDGYVYDNPSTKFSAAEHSAQTGLNISSNAAFTLTSLPHNLVKISLNTGYETLLNVPDIHSASLNVSVRDDISLLSDSIVLSPTLSLVCCSDTPQPATVVYNFGATFEPLHKFLIKCNTWRSYRRPDYTEKYYSQGLYIGNPDLKPETSYGGDFGISYDNKYFYAEAVGFCSYYLDLISYILSYGFVYRPINTGEVLSFGCELKCNIHFIKYFTIENSYTLNFVNSITDLSSGIWRQQIGYPVNTFWTKLSVDIFDYHFGVQFKFEDEISVTASGKVIPCKGLLDAFMRIDIPIRTFGLDCSICVNANNLLDILSFDERNYPLEGRSLILSVRLSQKATTHL